MADDGRDHARRVLHVVARLPQGGEQGVAALPRPDRRMRFAKCLRLARTQPQFGEDAARLDRDAGIDQHGEKRRQIERGAEIVADAAHHAGAGLETDRHVGARQPGRRHHARVVQREVVGARQQA